jgi:dihydropteroate synthase
MGGPFEETFGKRARRLEARALAPVSDERVDLCFNPEGLEGGETSDLQSRGRYRPAAPGGLARWRGYGDELEALHHRWNTVAPLARAHRNASAFPLPTRLMGIVNVTPDSFSDGGECFEPEAAIEHGLKLIAEEELDRVLGVVETLAAKGGVPVSIDTQKACVARAALAAGATMVNDVSAGKDPDMFATVAERGGMICLMHMRGTPEDMQSEPHYRDCVREVTFFLRERAAVALNAGIDGSRMILDPGIGFGKRLEDNLALIRALPELRSLGLPLMLGVSRKSFLGRLGGEPRAARRAEETIAALSLGAYLGADLHRVHDVAAARKALSVITAFPEPAIHA